MRKGACRTILYDFIPLINVLRISRTLFYPIHWAITKQTIDMFAIMTGIVFTISVFKIIICCTIFFFHTIHLIIIILQFFIQGIFNNTTYLMWFRILNIMTALIDNIKRFIKAIYTHIILNSLHRTGIV